ncbi:unnamed protein product [Ranitomeya imitator]|uniref:Uncharacterized protein n=1 Tax=Ranitomeya imitator TaxID=111125 RepID=A0ABN9LYQ7_9NEOB|nr:unnamed protein product [Ranitomeya imitator]
MDVVQPMRALCYKKQSVEVTKRSPLMNDECWRGMVAPEKKEH